MAKPKVPEQDFIDLWNRLGSAKLVAKELEMAERAVLHRRNSIEARLNIELPAHNDQRLGRRTILHKEDRIRSVAEIEGVVIVFSDAHFMPQESSPAFKAMLKLIKRLKPQLVVANGDILDGGTISRYGPEDWSPKATLKEELEAVQWHMDQIVKACKGLGTILHRTVGNHDIRFDKRLAGQVPEYRDISGTRLADHIPEWTVSWSLAVNENTMIKHRMQHSGIHSGYNNTLKSGLNAITGHTHLLEVKPWGDYRGRRYGVSTGMLADPDSKAFRYIEDNPVPWCSGFAVLTYHNGKLLMPELVETIDGTAYFRGAPV
jgi:hypothetical protein